MSEPTIEQCYLEVRSRVDELLRGRDGEELLLPVPACPGWNVHDVVAHLVGVVEWAGSGRLQGLPSDDDTAEQVAERRDVPTDELLDRWAEIGPGFATIVDQGGIWPAAIDAASHEQDIRGALGELGGRDAPSTRRLAGILLAGWRPPAAVEVETDSRTVVVGGENPELHLRTTDYEVLRWRMGRRSRAQMAAMEWTGDPTPILDTLHVFGPAEHDVIE